jgi:signal transduction histidine kinase
MGKLHKWWGQYLNGHSLENRVFVFANLSALFLTLIGIGFNLGAGAFPLQTTWLVMAAASYALSTTYAIWKPNRTAPKWFFVGATLPILGVSWFLNGGSHGSTILFYFLFIFLVILLNRARTHYLIGLGFSAFVVLTLVLEFYFPEWVVPYPDQPTRYWDTGLSTISTLWLFVLMVKVFKENYDQERRKVKSQHQELSQKTEEISQQHDQLVGQSAQMQAMYQQMEQANQALVKANQREKAYRAILEKHNQKLQQVNQTKNNLFSIISHDLRSPFASYISVLGLLEDQDLSPAERETVFNELKRSTLEVYNTLDNLLTWSKSQMDGFVTKPEPVLLRPVVQEIIHFFGVQAVKKKVSLANEVAPDLAVQADEAQVRIVLRNLIGNALKFTREGGCVTTTAQPEGALARVCVRDNGRGMDEATLQRLFQDPVSTLGTHGEKGTGLGLFLCKEFVQKNGGKIWAESQIGQGTVFCFTLAQAKVDQNVISS